MRNEDKLSYQKYLDKLERIRESSHVNLNESKSEKEARIQRCKVDYNFFVQTYFPHYAKSGCAPFHIKAANTVRKNRYVKAVMEWARGHAKSTHFNIFIPFWLWLNNDLKVMVLVGKSEDDAKTLLSDLQAEFESNPQIISDFGEQMGIGNWEEGNFVTKNGVAFFSLGRGQSPRGLRYRQFRPDYIVCDDIDDDILVKNPRRVKETSEWIMSALMGCMDIGGARFILVNNRIATDSILTNVLLRPGIFHMKVNALDKEGNPSWIQKYTKQYFKELEHFIGHFAFQKEYMNNPVIEGKIFKSTDIQWVAMPRLDHFKTIVGHWDVAYAGTPTADYNAVKVWGLKDKTFNHLKAFVRQCKMKEAVEWMFYMNEQMPETAQINWQFESQFWNDALRMVVEQVESEKKKSLNLSRVERPVKNKYDRIIAMQPHYQNRRIFHNIKEKGNNDMEAGLAQLYGIEPGYKTHDDGPDADEGAIKKLSLFLPNNSAMPLLGTRPERNGLY